MTWKKARLKDLCVDAGQYGLNMSADSYVDYGVRITRTSDITESGHLRNEDQAVFVNGALEDRHRLRAGDLLLSRSGTLGRALLVPALDDPVTYAGYLVRFRHRFDVDPRFLKYAVASQPVQDAILAEAVVSTIGNFNAERYANLSMDAPDLPEQRRIADFLDAETSRLDAIVFRRSQQLRTLAERDQAFLDSALILKGDRRMALSRLCRIQTGVTVDSGRDVSSGVQRPYLRVANVKADRLALDDVRRITVAPEEARRSTLCAGDVLMTEGGDLDKLGRGTLWRGEIPNCLHQNHVFALRPSAALSGEYLALLTRTSLARSYFERTGVKTTNLASTNSSKILSFRIPYPDVPEQERRASSAYVALSESSRLANAWGRQIELLAERRQALITAAATGQLDVTTARGDAGPGL